MIPFGPVTLHSQRVRLEPLTLAHEGPMAAALESEPRDSYALTGVPNGLPQVRRYLEDALAMGKAGTAVPFVTLDAERGNAIVGSTRFGNAEYWPALLGAARDRPAGSPDAVEIGWTWLLPSAQRTGINREAKALMLAHAFDAWEVHRVTLKTDVLNLRSRAAIEAIGGKLDGILRAHMRASDGTPRTTAYYTILREDYRAAPLQGGRGGERPARTI